MSDNDKKRVLMLVDDDPSLLNNLKDFLTFEGYEVVTASSGEKALVELRTTTPDLIILDMSMPGMGGIGFLDRITNLDGTTAYPVLVLTARAMMAEYFADKQIDGFLAKPTDPTDLLEEINRIIFLRGGVGNVPPQETVGKFRRIVLGEGKTAFAEMLREAFQKFDVRVEVVHTGAAVVENAVAMQPDAVVIRLELAEMSGDEVVKMLKRLPSTRAIPIVVYGLDAPDAQIEHVGNLDVDQITALRDVSIDRIISSTLAVSKK